MGRVQMSSSWWVRAAFALVAAVAVILTSALPSGAQTEDYDLPWFGEARISQDYIGATHKVEDREIDFVPDDFRILAIGNGVVTPHGCIRNSVYDASFTLETDAGHRFVYVHLDVEGLDPRFYDGVPFRVDKNDVLGRLYPNPFQRVGGNACGVSSTGAHLHLEIPSRDLVIDGVDFGTEASPPSSSGAQGDIFYTNVLTSHAGAEGAPTAPTRFNSDVRSTLTATGRAVSLQVCGSGINGQTVNVVFSNGERQSQTGTTAPCVTFASTESFGTATFARSRAQLNTTPVEATLDACAAATNFAALCDRVTLSAPPAPPPAPLAPTCVATGDAGYQVEWNSVPGATSYQYSVRRSGESVSAWTSSGTDRTRSVGPDFAESTWRVRSLNDGGPGPASPWSAACPAASELELLPPSPPTGVVCSVAPAGNLSAQWVFEPTQGITNFTIQWQNPGDNSISQRETGSAGPGGAVHEAESGARIRVIAVSEAGASPPSEWSAPCPSPAPAQPSETTSALCNGLVVTVDLGLGQSPTDGDDVILGTEGRDTINAGAGRDVICGLGGDDVINAGDGADIVFGGEGNDVINAGQGRDVVDAGAGNDFVSGGKGKDTISGSSGDDDLRGNEGTDTLLGGAGDDSLRGGQKADSLAGGAGSDSLVGGTRPDVLDGGTGLDDYNGGGGLDTCVADPSNLIEDRVSCERRT